MEKEEVFDILEKAYFGNAVDEEFELSQLSRMIDGVDLFIDLGASLGPYTHRAHTLLTGATLVAVEADPWRAERLAQLATKWGAMPVIISLFLIAQLAVRSEKPLF